MSWKRESAAIGAVLLLVTPAFSNVLFSGKSFFIRDLARIYYPELAALREIIRSETSPSCRFIAALALLIVALRSRAQPLQSPR